MSFVREFIDCIVTAYNIVFNEDFNMTAVNVSNGIINRQLTDDISKLIVLIELKEGFNELLNHPNIEPQFKALYEIVINFVANCEMNAKDLQTENVNWYNYAKNSGVNNFLRECWTVIASILHRINEYILANQYFTDDTAKYDVMCLKDELSLVEGTLNNLIENPSPISDSSTSSGTSTSSSTSC